MADEPSNDLQVTNPDAGFSFRAEMFMTNVVMGYWKVIVGVVVVFLFSVLVYGQYRNWYASGQFDTNTNVSKVVRQFEKKHGATLVPGSFLLVPGGVHTSTGGKPALYFRDRPLAMTGDEELTQDALTAGRVLRETAEKGTGAAAAQAYLYSAEFYRLAGDPAERAKSLELMTAANSAEAGAVALARVGATRQANDAGAALGDYASIAQNHKGTIFAQWALYDRARLLQDLDRNEEAVGDFQTLIADYPDSPLRDTVEAQLEELGVTAEADSTDAGGSEEEEGAPNVPGDGEEGAATNTDLEPDEDAE